MRTNLLQLIRQSFPRVSLLLDIYSHKRVCFSRDKTRTAFKTMKQGFLVLLLSTLLLLSVCVRAEEDEGADDLETLLGASYNETGFGEDCAAMTEMCTPDMFCAANGVCHLRTCENFYQYAPEVWTGRLPSGAQTMMDQQDDEGMAEGGELECYMNEFPDTVDPPCHDDEGGPLFPVAVHYSCHENFSSTQSVGLQCSEWDDVEMGHHGSGGNRQRRFATANRVCTAKPNAEQRFVCYDMAPDTNFTSYFETYGAAIESCDECQDDACTVDSFAGCDSTVPSGSNNMTWVSNGHQITSQLRVITSSGSIGDNTFLPGVDGNLGESFDPSLVGTRSINTMLISDPSTTNGTSTTGTGELGSSSPQRNWSLLSSIVSIVSVSTTIVGW